MQNVDFFEDVDSFAQELRSKPPVKEICWNCSRTSEVIFLNVNEDMVILKKDHGVPSPIYLCVTCATDYLNSYNRLAAATHKEREVPMWTAERVRALVSRPCRGCASSGRPHKHPISDMGIVRAESAMMLAGLRDEYGVNSWYEREWYKRYGIQYMPSSGRK